MDFAAARRHMVESQVRPNDVTDIAIQNAMLATPKEAYLPSDFRAQAYVDRELTYAPGRTVPAARDLAKLLAAAEPTTTDIVLQPACGGGYVTALLARLTEMVVAIEDSQPLLAAAQTALSDADLTNVAVIEGDPAAGAPKQGPFDLIFLASAVEIVPEALLRQLKDGGRLATFLREGGVSRGVVVGRSGDTFSAARRFDATARVILPGFERKPGFVF